MRIFFYGMNSKGPNCLIDPYESAQYTCVTQQQIAGRADAALEGVTCTSDSQ